MHNYLVPEYDGETGIHVRGQTRRLGRIFFRPRIVVSPPDWIPRPEHTVTRLSSSDGDSMQRIVSGRSASTHSASLCSDRLPRRARHVGPPAFPPLRPLQI